MEYTYAVLLLEESGMEINEDNLAAVLASADVEINWSTVKATVAALEGVHIQDVIRDTNGSTADGATESVGVGAPTVESGTDGRLDGDRQADRELSTDEPGSVETVETGDLSDDCDGVGGS